MSFSQIPFINAVGGSAAFSQVNFHQEYIGEIKYLNLLLYYYQHTQRNQAILRMFRYEGMSPRCRTTFFNSFFHLLVSHYLLNYVFLIKL